MADEQKKADIALSPEQAYVCLDELLQLALHYGKLLNMHDGGSRALPATVREWVDRLGEQGKLPGRPPATNGIVVESIIAARNQRPYVRISNDAGIVAQLSTVVAREVANNILSATSAAEADAMIHRFFKKMEFPDAALGALMTEFRGFRTELEDGQ